MKLSLLKTMMLVALLLLAPPPAQADPQNVVKIATTAAYANGKIVLPRLDYVVDQQGWLRTELAKHGYALSWYPVSTAATGPLINEAFANHLIQFGEYSDLPSIILNGSSPSLRTQLVVPWPPNDSYLVVPASSQAASIDDLKGKRLAVHEGRPWELPLLRLLDSKGLSYRDFQLYNINLEAGTTAVATGGVDALITSTPFNIVDKGVAKIIWSTEDSPLSWKSWGGLWADRAFTTAHPELTQLVVTAYVKAAQWASKDGNRDTIIGLQTRDGTSLRAATWYYDQTHLSWHDRWSPHFPPELYEHYRVDIGYATSKQIIRYPIDVDALLDPHFVTTALRDLDLQNYWVK